MTKLNIESEQSLKERLIKELVDLITDERFRSINMREPLPIIINDLENAKYFAEVKQLKKLLREIKRQRFYLKRYIDDIVRYTGDNTYIVKIYTNSGLYSLEHNAKDIRFSSFSNKNIVIFLHSLYAFVEGLKKGVNLYVNGLVKGDKQ